MNTTYVEETAAQRQRLTGDHIDVLGINAPTSRVCGRCGYEGTDWLDDGETCPQCKLVQ